MTFPDIGRRGPWGAALHAALHRMYVSHAQLVSGYACAQPHTVQVYKSRHGTAIMALPWWFAGPVTTALTHSDADSVGAKKEAKLKVKKVTLHI